MVRLAQLTKQERLGAVHAKALADFDDIQTAVMHERELCLQDRRFYTIQGAQWEGEFSEPFSNRPRLEMNFVHRAVVRIVAEYRNNRISVDFVPKDGIESDDLAAACDMLYRADEQDSGTEAFDNAFEEAVAGGIGAWRVRNCYEDEYDPANEKQRIRFEPINDADSCVFWDLNAKRQDKADAKYCFVLTPMSVDAYKDQWGDDPASWPKDVSGRLFDWAVDNQVYVAEYYTAEERSTRMLTYRDLGGMEAVIREDELDDEKQAEMDALGTVMIAERRIKSRAVHKYIMSGGKVLDDCGYIAGTEIPIIMVYGKRVVVDGIERAIGHVRFAKDAQRLKNMQTSALADMAARSPVRTPIFTPQQVAGLENLWGNAAKTNPAYMLVNPIVGPDGSLTPVGQVGEVSPPDVPPAMAALIQIADSNIAEILGNMQNGERMEPNLSGKAIELIQTRIDAQTGIYMDNMARAVRRCGEVWLSMARGIYVEEGRRMKGVSPSGEAESIVLGEAVLDEDTATVRRKIDMSRAKFDVAVDVGPSSSSRRAATVRAVTGMLQMVQDPQDAAVLIAVAMQNMEGEGLPDIRRFFRKKLLRMGVVLPTEGEKEEMALEAQAAQQPDPQAVYLQAAAMEASARAQKAQADTGLAVAKAKQAEADTLKTLAAIDRDDQEAAIKTAQAMSQAVRMPQPVGG